MIIDIIVAVLLIMAAVKGFRLGLISGVLSYIAFIVGLAAAMKLSAVVAAKMGQTLNLSEKWLSFLSFIAVFILVVILIKWLAKFLQIFFEKIMLGGINKLGGIIFYGLIYTSAFGVIIFYINKLNLIPQTALDTSLTYKYIIAIGTYAVDALGYIIPAFKDLFGQLEQFFENTANNIE